MVEQRFALNGLISDYPFDHYSALLDYHVVGGPDADELPVALNLYSTDPFFAIDSSAAEIQDGGVGIALKLRRSTPTLVYASFVMVLMLGLAVAAITAAYYTLKWRKGLLFPACGMMAAMLFALVPLRNAVPGSPDRIGHRLRLLLHRRHHHRCITDCLRGHRLPGPGRQRPG